MGIDLDVVFAATVTAEQAFALPARLNQAPAVVAASRADCERTQTALEEWAWDKHWPAITAPSGIVEAWASRNVGSVLLSGTPGLLYLQPNRIRLYPGVKLSGFASDHEGCQAPIRRVCRALACELGADRVLYLPDSGDWPSEVGDLGDLQFDEALARLAAWGPPVSAIGALRYGSGLRLGFHYADGALRRPDGSPVPEAEIIPGYGRIWSGGVASRVPVPHAQPARSRRRTGTARRRCSRWHRRHAGSRRYRRCSPPDRRS